jgi:hypothetical protein
MAKNDYKSKDVNNNGKVENKDLGIIGTPTKIGRSGNLNYKINQLKNNKLRILALTEAMLLGETARTMTAGRLLKEGFRRCLMIMHEATTVLDGSADSVYSQDIKIGLQMAFKSVILLIEALRAEIDDEEKTGARIAPSYGGKNDKR